MELEHKADMLVAEVGQLGRRERRNINAVHFDGAAIWLVECANYLQQGGLACSTWTHDAYNLAFVNMKIDAFQHL